MVSAAWSHMNLLMSAITTITVSARSNTMITTRQPRVSLKLEPPPPHIAFIRSCVSITFCVSSTTTHKAHMRHPTEIA